MKELVERIVASPAIEALSGVPRYDMYMDDLTPMEWIKLLDVDFDNREHVFKTALLSHAIAEMDGSSPLETVKLPV